MDLTKKINNQKAQYNTLNSQLKSVTEELTNALSLRDDALRELVSAREELSFIERDRTIKQTAANALATVISELKEEFTELNNDISLAKQTYKTTKGNIQRDINAEIARADNVRSDLQVDKAIAEDAYRNILSKLVSAQENYVKEQSRLNTELNRKKESVKEVEDKAEDAQEILSILSAEIDKKDTILKEKSNEIHLIREEAHMIHKSLDKRKKEIQDKERNTAVINRRANALYKKLKNK